LIIVAILGHSLALESGRKGHGEAERDGETKEFEVELIAPQKVPLSCELILKFPCIQITLLPHFFRQSSIA